MENTYIGKNVYVNSACIVDNVNLRRIASRNSSGGPSNIKSESTELAYGTRHIGTRSFNFADLFSVFLPVTSASRRHDLNSGFKSSL